MGNLKILYIPLFFGIKKILFLLIENDSVVKTGDAIALEDNLPVIANPQFTLNMEQATKSMEKLLSIKANAYYCYHGGVYSPTDRNTSNEYDF